MGKLQHAAAAAGRVFHARVLAELGPVMRVRGLRLLSGGPGDVATLYGDRCLVRLRLDEDGEVCCTLNDLVRGGEFELVLCVLLLKQNSQNSQNLQNLSGIGLALMGRWLDGVFAGDFSWARDYWLLREEAFTVGEELVPVLRRGGGDLRELLRMIRAGDPGWIDEGRKVVGIRDAVDER